MKAGFGRADITPRVGVELCGFGPYLNRRSVAVRDRLWARAVAIESGGRVAVLVSCDLIGVELATTHRVRELVKQATGLPAEAVMVHCTHTHSGPATIDLRGWGVVDRPYKEILPHRIARACIAAVENRAEATLCHAEAPCEGIGLNREQDKDAPPLAEVLRDDWRPARPELTDTTCHVLKFQSGGRTAGFASYFGCHPVVCCQQTHYVHGDFAGVATNALEGENAGSTGLFLQGAQGDVNSCVVHKPEKEALSALDVIAGRYARAAGEALRQAAPVEVDAVRCTLKEVVFSRHTAPLAELRSSLAQQDAFLAAPGASDEDRAVRMATVHAIALRKIIGRLEAGESLEEPTQLQGFRIGPIAVLAAPFEVFQAVKNDVVAKAKTPLTLVMGLTNDYQGYAPDRAAAERGGYAARTVPVILGALPYADIHGQLVAALAEVEEQLR